jgi:AraC family transcriptional regulator
MSTLYIKNMVCDRCISAVRQELDKHGLHPERITLGEVQLKEETLSENQQRALDEGLLQLGFERIDDRKGRMIESIKNKVIEMIHRSDKVQVRSNWSTVLAEELHHDYSYLSTLFSGIEGITLEQYIIRQKIEKVKELLLYDELTLSEIAYRLGYSSVAHLSGQFKKVTGYTPSALKKSRDISKTRKPLDGV